jgi:hypothetical protein
VFVEIFIITYRDYFTLRHFKSKGRDSSVGIATRYGLDGPGMESRWEARFSAPVQTGPGAHPASYTMGTGSFPGVKRPGRGVDYPPPSRAEVKERVELYLYYPPGPLWPVIGELYLYLYHCKSNCMKTGISVYYHSEKRATNAKILLGYANI